MIDEQTAGLYLISPSGDAFTNPLFLLASCFAVKPCPASSELPYMGGRSAEVWISPDPMRQFHSPYATSGNPINNVDPNGLAEVPANFIGPLQVGDYRAGDAAGFQEANFWAFQTQAGASLTFGVIGMMHAELNGGVIASPTGQHYLNVNFLASVGVGPAAGAAVGANLGAGMTKNPAPGASASLVQYTEFGAYDVAGGGGSFTYTYDYPYVRPAGFGLGAAVKPGVGLGAWLFSGPGVNFNLNAPLPPNGPGPSVPWTPNMRPR